MSDTYCDSPIIILGMHRSGTSMVSGLLRDMGLFVGSDLFDDIHNESKYFLETNEELLRRIGGFWDRVDNIKYFLENDDLCEMTAKCLDADINSSKIKKFAGKYKTIKSIDRPWGWKDPRTMVTASLWFRLFPNAKIVYIARNGIDVASSLKVREIKNLEKRKIKYAKKFKNSLSLHSKLESSGYKGSARCLSLEGGFSLWEDYVEFAERTISEMKNERIIIKYEDILKEPVKYLKELADFCGLSQDRVEELAGTIKPGRGSAYLNDPELKEFYDTVKDTKWMKEYGY